jgi:hypothetical protein
VTALPEAKDRYLPEYLSHPETAVIAFDELWRAAGEDGWKQYSACIKTLEWVLLELRAASKSGRRFIRSLPHDEFVLSEAGSGLLTPHRRFHDLYFDRVDWLRRSANMAYRGHGKFNMVIDAIIELVEGIGESAERGSMSGPRTAEILGRMDSAAETLEELLPDYTPTPPQNGNGPRANSYAALPELDRQIIETLRVVGYRLTTMKLYREMDRPNRPVSLPTLKRRLAELVDGRWLDNDPKAKPRGYGLPEWRSGSSGA